MTKWQLLVDIGGTNVRFARMASDRELRSHRTYLTAHYENFEAALTAYFSDTDESANYGSAAIAAAGPVTDGFVQLTNCPWHVSEKEVSQIIGGGPAQLVNDLEAVALALPHLTETEIQPIGPVPEVGIKCAAMIAINVGTGFGAASIIPSNDGWITRASEAGHMSFGLNKASEFQWLAGISEDIQSIEDILSGHGLFQIYRALNKRHASTSRAAKSAPEVIACHAVDPVAAEAIKTFTILLGRVAGDLMLASGAWGGVFLIGGVLTGWQAVADVELFRQNFEAKGKMKDRMRDVFTGLITRHDVALFGLSRLNMT